MKERYLFKGTLVEFWQMIHDHFEIIGNNHKLINANIFLSDDTGNRMPAFQLWIHDEDIWGRIYATPIHNLEWISIHVEIDSRVEEEGKPIWDGFLSKITEQGFILRNITADEKNLETKRVELGVEGGVLFETTWRTTPDYVFQIIRDSLIEIISTDERYTGINVQTYHFNKSIQYEIGWGLPSSYGYVLVTPINDIQSHLKVYCYPARAVDNAEIDFYQAGKLLLSKITLNLVEIFRLGGLDEDNYHLHSIKSQSSGHMNKRGVLAFELDRDDANIHPTGETEQPKLSDRDIELLEYWNQGYTAEYIGEELGLARGTIWNIIRELRRKHGKEFVKYHNGK